MKPTTLLTAITLSTTALANGVLAQDYDVAILNGRVMDPETGFDQIANVGINNGWITEITTDPIEGENTIDAAGHVVAPGFIDLEQHGLSPFGIKLNLRDGVTTQMDFEVGAINISEWYSERDGKLQANYGTVVGQEFARMRVHDGLALEGPNVSMPYFFDFRADAAEDGVDGWSVTRSNLEQMNEITAILDEGLRQGALGVGSTIGYAREGITTYEMFEAQKIAAKYDRLTAAHHRFHPSASTPIETATGANELLTNAMVLGASLQLHHTNDYGWWEIEEKMQLARAQGYNVWSTWYPWTAGSGNYGASILAPDNWEDSMGYKYEETIFDPQLDRYVTKEEFLEFKESEPGRTAIAFSPPREQWIKDWIKVPNFVISGDGMPALNEKGERLEWDSPFEEYAGHPRSAGSHAILLRLARENDVPLMFSLAQLSYWAAKQLGDAGIEEMDVRGRLQEGMIADITIFDPESVTENASYSKGKNGLASTGIPYVLVHGTIVVSDSKVLKDVNPGQAIRYPVEEEGRFEPSNKQQWLRTFTIDTGGARPTLYDDILDDQSSLEGPGSSEPVNYRVAKVDLTINKPQDWFAQPNTIDDSELFLCPVHGVYEDKRTAQQDWAQALIVRNSNASTYDPLLSPGTNSK
ncbi:aminoacylase (plasmid) [Sulfitobacter sp. SK012]|uniref:amidohydrolase family protein n=1 Tax=Sulfitobacter sp. SK012 TaxID=1389005 RepID=UPI000E0BECAB|nr:amidohydrolase family protein [Sulfitobacter sp. SK012]AXI49069.1 aminoacylase [Sulfitobacter sp. SK012]